MAAGAFSGYDGLLGTPKGLPNNRLQDLTPELDVGEGGGRRPLVRNVLQEPDAEWAVRQIRREMPRIEAFRAEARKAFGFFDGDQVGDADKAAMELAGRPIITLNEVQKFIRIVDGIERRAPLSLYYLARNPDDVRAAFKGELRSLAKEWAYENSFYSFEIPRAKKDRLICGMGWVEEYISRSENPAGKLETTRFSPFEAIFPSCSRECLHGARWLGRKRKMPVDAAIQKWPHVADILMAAAGGSGAPKDYPVKADLVKYRVPWIMTEPTNKGGSTPPDPEEVAVTDFQYTKGTEGYWFKDPILGEDRWLETSEFNKYSKLLSEKAGQLPRNAEKVIKDVYWRIFLLNDSFVLDGPKTMPIDGFSLRCVTGDWDEKRKMWYGLMRIWFDPQLLIDKCASSAVEILASQAKSGLDVEQGSMSQEQKNAAAKTNSIPGRVLEFKRNAIAENRTRYVQPTPLPGGLSELLEFGVKEIDNLTTIVSSLMSAQGANSGVGMRHQVTVGLLFLASYLDSSARFEYNLADTTQKHLKILSDDRWIRIGGPGAEQYVRLAKGDFDDMLDITVDSTERDPTLRRWWADNLVQLTPMLIKMQAFDPSLLDILQGTLPMRNMMKLKQFIQQKAQMDQQMRLAGVGQPGRGKSRTPDEVKADTAATQAKAALGFAKAAHLNAQAGDIKLARQSQGLSDIMEGFLNIHKADLEERQHRVQRAQAAADIFDTLRGQQGPQQ